MDELNDKTQHWIENDYNAKHHTGIRMNPVDRFNLDHNRIQFLTDDVVHREVFLSKKPEGLKNQCVLHQLTKYECPVDLRRKSRSRYDRTKAGSFYRLLCR